MDLVLHLVTAYRIGSFTVASYSFDLYAHFNPECFKLQKKLFFLKPQTMSLRDSISQFEPTPESLVLPICMRQLVFLKPLAIM